VNDEVDARRLCGFLGSVIDLVKEECLLIDGHQRDGLGLRGRDAER
jgi:hypothetical protein